jgi:ADP-ribosylglycohydrolase
VGYEMPYPNDLLYDKILGCLAGGYVGASMGEPARRLGGDQFSPEEGFLGHLEGAHYTVIDKYFGDFLENPRLLPVKKRARWHRFHNGRLWYYPEMEYPPGATEDGAERRFILIKAIIDKGDRVTAEDYANAYLKYVKPEYIGYFLLPHCDGVAYENIKKYGAREAGKYFLFPGLGDVLMLIHPIGIINACNPRQAALDAFDVTQCRQWRGNSFAVDCAAALAAAIAEAFNPDSTIDSIIEAAKAYVIEDVRELIDEAVEIVNKYKTYEDVRAVLWRKWAGFPCTYALEVLQESIALFYLFKGDPVKVMAGGTRFGRDADCLASNGGAIAGAFMGAKKIPRHFIDTVNKAWEQLRPKTIIDIPMEEQALKLYEITLKIAKESSWNYRRAHEKILRLLEIKV